MFIQLVNCKIKCKEKKKTATVATLKRKNKKQNRIEYLPGASKFNNTVIVKNISFLSFSSYPCLTKSIGLLLLNGAYNRKLSICNCSILVLIIKHLKTGKKQINK